MKPTDALPHPNDWQTAIVGNAIEIKRGVSWSKDQEHSAPYDGAVRVIGISNVQEQLDLDKVLYLSGVKRKAIEKKRVEKGWSVIVGSNGNRQRIGNAVFVAEDSEFLFASFLIAAKPKQESAITPEFFFRWLRTEQVQAYLSASSEGSTGLSNLSHSFFRSMSIAFPESDQQTAIARILDAVDKAIERARDALIQAKGLRKALVEDFFVRRDAAQKRLKDYITDVRYGTSQASSERGWGNPVLRIPNVVSDQLTLSDIAYVDLRPVDVERLLLQDGDLLLVRTNGNPNYVGRSAVFHTPDNRTWVYASYLIRVRLTAGLSSDYVNIFLGSERGRRELLRRVTTSAGNHNINANSIRLLSIPVPLNKAAQQELVDLANASRARAEAFGNKLAALEALKKSLMHDLLTGTVRVADCDINPPP